MKKLLPGTFSGWMLLLCASGLFTEITYIFLTGDSPFVPFGVSAGEAVAALVVAVVVVWVVSWITQEEGRE